MTLAMGLVLVNMQARERVKVTHFGAYPSDGVDDTQGLRAAAEYARQHPGTILVMPAGDYLLSDAKAEELERRVLNGELGENPESQMFTPYHEYVRGLDFTGSERVRIEAKGARLMVSGWMEPVTLSDCRNFEIRGLEIDYQRRPLSEGHIVAIEEGTFTVQFDHTPVPITSRTPFPRVIFWDNNYDGVYPHVFYYAREAVVGENRVRFRGKMPQYMVGAKVGAPHCFHFRPTIFIHESDDVTLQDVTIRSQCGMGVVGFHTGNVLMRRMHIVPAEGRTFSTNTDATHFASCWGRLEFDHCTFQGQGDDATNVHGYLHDMDRQSDCKVRLALNAPTFTHAQMADVPRLGDVMTLVQTNDMVPVEDYRVVAVEHQPKGVDYVIEVDHPLPADCSPYNMINKTLMPHVSYHHCDDYGHIARGVLIKTTGGAEIYNNTFRGLNLPAIVLSSEGSWKEGWHTTDAVIRNNHIIHCGPYSDQYDGAGIALRVECPDTKAAVHQRIVIQNNVIEDVRPDRPAIYVRNAEDVTMRGNKVVHLKSEK